METLVAIFGNLIKVKIMRLFLFNDTTTFTLGEIVDRTKSGIPLVRKELAVLEKAEIIRSKHISKEIQISQGKRIVLKKVEGKGYYLNSKFAYLDSLKNLLTISSIKVDDSFIKRFSGSGKIKLLIVSGVFIQNWDSRVDLLIVGDDLGFVKIESTIKKIESEIGKEIAYSAFETQDFEYRLGIHDRLVRDILDYPHTTLLDRLGIEPN